MMEVYGMCEEKIKGGIWSLPRRRMGSKGGKGMGGVGVNWGFD